MAAPARVGNWMQTVGGRAFYPLDPRPEDVAIRDIAHALSFVCRFGGHCTEFYSVAEHSVRVADAVRAAGGSAQETFHALMHDAAEAYVGDMVWPLKQAHALVGYKGIERLIENAIAQRFGLELAMPAIVKRFDLVLLSTEKRDLMVDGVGREAGARREAGASTAALGRWHSDDFEPLPEKIVPLSPSVARTRFMARFQIWGQR